MAIHNVYNIPKYLTADDVVIDIGANCGAFSFLCWKKGARNIESYEAESTNFNILKMNLLDKKGCKPYKYAVWRSDIDKNFLYHSGNSVGCDGHIFTGGGNVLFPLTKNAQKTKVIKLDSILTKFNTVSILKLDCEGSEFPILLTSKLLNKCKRITGEFHEILGDYEINTARSIPSDAVIPGWDKFTMNLLKGYLEEIGFNVSYTRSRFSTGEPTRLGYFNAIRGPISV